MNAFYHRLGIWRSLAMYYGKPFNRRKLKKFYRDFIQPGDLCFDVGAHLGNRTDSWLRLGARVVALEPQPHCMRFLQKKFGRNTSATLLDEAIGAETGKGELMVSTLTPTISTLSGKDWQQAMQEKTSFNVSWDYAVPVTITTLDDLISRFGMPAFVKIDVEDFEIQALMGLSQAIPCLSFEYFAPTALQGVKCIHRLEELGDYEYNWSLGESLSLEAAQWVSSEEMVAFLERLTEEDRSGDIYARLK